MICISRCFREAFEVYGRNLFVLVIAAALFDLLGLVSLLILAGPLAGGFSPLTFRSIRSSQRRAALGDLFAGFRLFLPLLGLFFLTLIPILVGLLLFVIPGVLLATIWMFVFLLVVDRGEPVFDSLGRSYAMVRRGGFGACLLLTISNLLLQVVPVLIPFAGFVVAWFTAPVGWLLVSSAYAQIVEADEAPPSGDELRRSTIDLGIR